MRIQAFLGSAKNILGNLKEMLKLAWEMDPKLTFWYYFTAALSAFAPLGVIFSLKYLIDNLQKYQAPGITTSIPLILIIVLGIQYLVTVLGDVVKYGLNITYFDYLFRYKLQNEFTYRFYSKVTKLDIAHLEDTEVQNLLTKTRDTVTWRPPDYLRMFRYFFESFVSLISTVIVLVTFGLWIPLIIILVSLPGLIFRMKYGAVEWSIFGSNAPETRRLWYLNYLLTQLNALKEIKVFRTREFLLGKYSSIQTKLFNEHKKPLDNYLKFLTLPSVLETAVLFVVATLFLPQVLVGVISIGSFALLVNMLDQMNNTVSSTVGNFATVHDHNLYVQHYIDVMKLEPRVKEDPKAQEIHSIKPPLIEFKDVSFAYPGGKDVLKKVSFMVKPGESIALVGPNGAGKSTIVKLLCRFYDVTSGEILINGINIKKLKLSNWYQFLGTLFQDFEKYHFSIEEDITLGVEGEVNEKLMKEAAKKAGASEFIEKLPDKYEQILGKEFGGEELSQGQWQKLSLARAFYEQPPVLILDEPTSAIDAEAEFEIFNNLEKEYKNKTLIFVSHRFSTVRNANKILVVEGGEIIEEGSHKQLIEKNGKYAKMFRTQARGYQ